MFTYHTCTLPNGLRVILKRQPSAVMYCGYAVNAGTRDELPGEEGMAHFAEHMSFKGTGRRRALSVINTLERVGGDLNAYTTKEATVYHAAVLTEHTRRAVDLLTDIVFHSTCPQAEMDKEVEVICDEIESYNDSPADLIYDLLEEALFPRHPLGNGILGQAPALRSYTQEGLMAFRRRLYTPAASVFFACGDVSFPLLVRMLCRAHGCAEPSCPPADAHVPAPLPPARLAPLPPYVPRHVARHMDTHQTHVMVGTRAYGQGHPRRLALSLLTNLLGGPGMNARLNLSLRERHALVYTVESFLTSYGDTGVWGIYFGCDPHDVRRCQRLVRRELDRLMQAPLSPAQLRAAQRQMKGQVGVACDGRENFTLDMARQFLHLGREKDVEALLRGIDAVTAQEVQQVACELFAPERLSSVVID